MTDLKKPLPPDVLADALQDRVHKHGRLLASKKVHPTRSPILDLIEKVERWQEDPY